MNLFDLFTKPKVERARGSHEPGLDSLPERSQTPAHFYREDEPTGNPEPADINVAQPPPRTSGSGISSQKRKPAKLERPPPSDWDPPPLFQAYPQAIKHGALQGTHVSTDTLLRAAHQRTYDGFGSTAALPLVSENQEIQNHGTQTRHVQKRFSTLVDSLGVTEKIFVLTTTGRIVQYSGKGKFDRLPEKILQLCHNSAAFASDVIPGKHWVLQVVQSVNQDGAPALKQSRSLLSRLRAANTATRKHATGLLMIFSTPDDMDSWLKALRKAIEQMGGKRIEPDPEPPTKKRPVESNSTATPSHRFQVQRDPRQPQPLKVHSKAANRPTSPKSAETSILQTPINQPPAPHLPSPEDTSVRTSRSDSPRTVPPERAGRSPRVNRINSAEASSVAAALGSPDQVPLEQMLNSSRYSLISTRTSRTSETEGATMPTSCGSSSPPSPRKESFTEPDAQRSPPGLKAFAIGSAVTTNLRCVPPQPQATPASRSSPQIPPRESSARIGGRVHGFGQWAEVSPTRPRVNASISNPRARQSLVGEETGSRISPVDHPTQTEPEVVTSEENGRPHSFIGQLPNISSRSISRSEQRTEPSRKPFLRPIPVKPSEPIGTQQRRASGNPETLRSDHSESLTARRVSSFPNPRTSTTDFHSFRSNGRASLLSQPVSHNPSHPLSVNYSPVPPANPNAAVSANGLSSTSTVKQTPSVTTQTLRRPNSMQIRSDPAPFLSSRQPQSRVRGDTRSSSGTSIQFSSSYSASRSSLFNAALIPEHPGFMNPNKPAIRIQSNTPTIVATGLPPPSHPPPNIPLPKVPDTQSSLVTA